ncbi:uncharacterized protein [Rutidosis leptorrhynchoides]|uniref:uncharacterized protein n=1 Tax=Rutidosis leptorrhynchoides TaxID=125765 RepID=UPI003A999AD9
MATKFLTKYFPPFKQTNLKNDIINFHQNYDESLYTAWERFKTLLKKCPNHQMEKSAQICTFYNGLTVNHRIKIDAAVQGNPMNQTVEAWELPKNMTMHHHDWNSAPKENLPGNQITKATNLSTEDQLNQFIQGQHQLNQRTAPRQDQTKALMKNQFALLKSLDLQLGQLSQQLETQPQGKLPSNTIQNPYIEEAKQMDSILPKEVPAPRRRSARLKNKSVNTQQLPKPNPVRVSYPGRLKENPEKLGTFKLYRKFLDSMSIVPNQNRYIRRLLSTKDRMPDSNKILLSEECTKLLRDSLPTKLGDTGRFTFPFSIYQSGTIHALADLGANINLMPYSLFKRLELGDLLPTKVTIQLADHTIHYPKDIVENILVKVE